MAISLHPKCKSRLIESVSQILSNVLVDNNVSLNYKSTLGLEQADKILESSGDIRDKLTRYVGEQPLFYFIYETISRDLSENGTYDSESKDLPLDTLPSYADLKGVANRLINDFESLPWVYSISYELPKGIGDKLREVVPQYELNNRLSIFSPDETYDKTYPLYSDSGGILSGLYYPSGFHPTQWNQETVYLKIETEGFIARYWKTMPIEEGISKLKAFMGLSLAVRLFKVGAGGIASLFGKPIKSYLVIHRCADTEWEIWSTYELPVDLSETLSKLEIDDLDGQLENQKIEGWIKRKLAQISVAFKEPQKAERILLAGQWLVDSYVGENELLSFVQTMVAMEILLGKGSNSDVIGIGELLKNRCAYLIGKSYEEREQILKWFDKIYDVRSRIVHEGKSRLTSEERRLFYILRWMCRRVINEELNLIVQDKGDSI